MMILDTKKLIRLFAILTICLVLSLSISAANLVVTNTDDSGAGSLRDAIAQAISNNEPDTITFDSAVFSSPQTINLTSGELFINWDNGNLLTINGPGSNLLTISAGNLSRVIFIRDSSNVSINGMTVKDGNAMGTNEPGNDLLGGAIMIRIATASFNDIVVSDSVARNGGGITGFGSDTTITNSQILRNKAENVEGGQAQGGGLYFHTANTRIKISNTVIKDNTSEVFYAGADLVATELDLSGLTIENNTVPDGTNGRVGGLRIGGGGRMVNSVIRGNKGTFYGGGISALPSGDLLFKAVTVDNNITSSIAGGRGCGIFRHAGPGRLIIMDSTISNNTCVDEDAPETPSAEPGGGLYNTGAGFTYLINTTVFNNKTHNSSFFTASGGGIYNAAQMHIINSTIVGNFAGAHGGGVLDKPASAGGSTTIVQNSIIAGNTSGVSAPDVHGDDFTSNGFNIIGNLDGGDTSGPGGFGVAGDMIGVNPLLDSNGLQDNGGSTLTIMPTQTSPAINNGSNALAVNEDGFSLRFDQRSNCFNRFISTVDIGAVEVGATQLSGSDTKFDFDGDCKTDIGIFRPSLGEWWYLRSSDLGNGALQFGSSTDVPTPADFTGDGKTDISFFRNGEWFVLRSEDDSFFSFPWGQTGDIPAPGDFDGDGQADPTVFRPNDQTWFILKSTGGVDFVPFGIAEDKPVIADYDGDGRDDIAVYRPSVSEWWINQSTDGSTALQFGQAGDRTVQGDYTGDGKADVSFFRPSTGEWFIIRSEDFSFFSFPFGATNDIPAPGDYDGDGTYDATVFRPQDTTWFINGTTSGVQIVGFGLNGDIPVPSVYSVP